MLTKKQMLRYQKMRAYLEIYGKLIEEDINNFLKNRKKSDQAHNLLIEIAGKAVDDKIIKG